MKANQPRQNAFLQVSYNNWPEFDRDCKSRRIYRMMIEPNPSSSDGQTWKQLWPMEATLASITG
jgi:hypothetical protein